MEAGARSLSFSVSERLRVEGGRVRLDVPTGRTRDGAVTREVVEAPLSPSGRAGRRIRGLAPAIAGRGRAAAAVDGFVPPRAPGGRGAGVQLARDAAPPLPDGGEISENRLTIVRDFAGFRPFGGKFAKWPVDAHMDQARPVAPLRLAGAARLAIVVGAATIRCSAELLE